MATLGIPPPDGGYGWAIVFAGFLAYSLFGGTGMAFGVLFVAFLDAFGASKAETAWIGSISMGAGVIFNFLALALLKKYEHRTVMMIGGIVYATGLLSSAFTTRIGQIYFTYGILGSIGTWLIILSVMEMVPRYFRKRLPLAMGFILAGGGVGQCVMSVTIPHLLDAYGWRGTLIVLAAVNLNLCVAASLFRPVTQDRPGAKEDPDEVTEGAKNSLRDQRGTGHNLSTTSQDISSVDKEKDSCGTEKGNNRSFLENIKALSPDWSLCCCLPFVLIAICGLFRSAGMVSVVSHSVKRGMEYGITNSEILPSVLGITQAVGPVFWGFFGVRVRKIKPIITLGATSAAAGIICFASIFMTTYAGQIIYMVLFGTCMACIVPMHAVTIQLMLDEQRMGSGLMFGSQAIGIGMLLGPPFIGWIRDVQGHYDGAFCVIGAMFIATSICVFLAAAADKYTSKKGRYNIDVVMSEAVVTLKEDKREEVI